MYVRHGHFKAVIVLSFFGFAGHLHNILASCFESKYVPRLTSSSGQTALAKTMHYAKRVLNWVRWSTAGGHFNPLNMKSS